MHYGGEARCVAGHMFQYGTIGKRVEFTRQRRRSGDARPSEGPELCVRLQLDRLRHSFLVCLTSYVHLKSKVTAFVKFCGIGSCHRSWMPLKAAVLYSVETYTACLPFFLCCVSKYRLMAFPIGRQQRSYLFVARGEWSQLSFTI